MALTFTTLTSGSDGTSSAASYSTASVAPSANALVLVAIHGEGFNAAHLPSSLTGNGLTWVQIDGLEGVGNVGYGGGSYEHFSLWRSMGASPSSGAITINWPSSDIDQAEWHVFEVTGVDTSGTNGSGAVVQVVNNTGSGTSASVTLAAFGSSSNGTYGAFGGYNTTAVRTGAVGSGFTELYDTGLSDFRQDSIYSEYKTSNDTSVDMTWSDTQTAWAGIAIEIKAAATPKGLILLMSGDGGFL